MSRAPRIAALAAGLLAAAAFATPSGHAWRTLPVKYKVFAHTSINGVPNFQQYALPALQRGFAHWVTPTVSCTRWQSAYDGTFTTPTDRTAINATDGLNRLIWLGGQDWVHDSATLALTSVTYIPGSGEITDADMELNNNQVWKVGGQALAVDVESILTHEGGHFLGLDHSPNTAAIMYANYAIGDVKTVLTPGDVNDVCTVYPSQASAGTQGAFCVSDSNCGSTAPACRAPAGSANSAICTVTCVNLTDPCPAGYTCQDASPTGRACLLKPGVPDLCHFCTGGAECLTGRCVTDGQHNWCTTTCRTASDCGPGYDCVSGGNVMVCAPTGTPPAKCATAQCVGNADCAPGYNCVSGMCEATGGLGDRCELSDFCNPCSVCVGDNDAAFCRACCGGQGTCKTCSGTPNSCGGDQSCAVLATADQACVPVTGGALCQSCSATSPCQAGFQCYGGRCHLPCNPNHPGNCSACGALGTGIGLCACADETAYAGQACDPPPGGYTACVNGTACVGTPKTCRAKCTVGDYNSCPSDQTCTTVDGIPVCMPATISQGNRCGAILDSTCSPNSCAAGLTCYANRCYEPCVPSNPSCAGCVVISQSQAVCACDDQRVGPGQSCGVTTTGVLACVPGSACTAQINGTCRSQCDPRAPQCPASESCEATDAGYLCIPGPDGGTPDGGTDGGSPDGGTGPTVKPGCGCSSDQGWATGWPLAILAATLLARRGAPRHREASRE